LQLYFTINLKKSSNVYWSCWSSSKFSQVPCTPLSLLERFSSDSVTGVSGFVEDGGISSCVSFTRKESWFKESEVSLLSSLVVLMIPASLSSRVSVLLSDRISVWFWMLRLFLSRNQWNDRMQQRSACQLRKEEAFELTYLWIQKPSCNNY
jgi:hypothetical protein